MQMPHFKTFPLLSLKFFLFFLFFVGTITQPNAGPPPLPKGESGEKEPVHSARHMMPPATDEIADVGSEAAVHASMVLADFPAVVQDHLYGYAGWEALATVARTSKRTHKIAQLLVEEYLKLTPLGSAHFEDPRTGAKTARAPLGILQEPLHTTMEKDKNLVDWLAPSYQPLIRKVCAPYAQILVSTNSRLYPLLRNALDLPGRPLPHIKVLSEYMQTAGMPWEEVAKLQYLYGGVAVLPNPFMHYDNGKAVLYPDDVEVSGGGGGGGCSSACGGCEHCDAPLFQLHAQRRGDRVMWHEGLKDKIRAHYRKKRVEPLFMSWTTAFAEKILRAVNADGEVIDEMPFLGLPQQAIILLQQKDLEIQREALTRYFQARPQDTLLLDLETRVEEGHESLELQLAGCMMDPVLSQHMREKMCDAILNGTKPTPGEIKRKMQVLKRAITLPIRRETQERIVGLPIEELPASLQYLSLTNSMGDAEIIRSDFISIDHLYSALGESSLLKSVDLGGLHNVHLIKDNFLSHLGSLEHINLRSLVNVNILGAFKNTISGNENLQWIGLHPLVNVLKVGPCFLSSACKLKNPDLMGLINVMQIQGQFLSQSGIRYLHLRPLEKLETVGNSLAGWCMHLEAVNVSGLRKLLSLGPYCFDSCWQLRAIKGLETLNLCVVEKESFRQCYLLPRLDFRGSHRLALIEGNCFYDCPQLMQIYWPKATNPFIDLLDFWTGVVPSDECPEDVRAAIRDARKKLWPEAGGAVPEAVVALRDHQRQRILEVSRNRGEPLPDGLVAENILLRHLLADRV